jgi:hypothetical protein
VCSPGARERLAPLPRHKRRPGATTDGIAARANGLRSSQVTSRFGMNSGLTQGEVAEAIAHLAFEVG